MYSHSYSPPAHSHVDGYHQHAAEGYHCFNHKGSPCGCEHFEDRIAALRIVDHSPPGAWDTKVPDAASLDTKRRCDCVHFDKENMDSLEQFKPRRSSLLSIESLYKPHSPCFRQRHFYPAYKHVTIHRSPSSSSSSSSGGTPPQSPNVDSSPSTTRSTNPGTRRSTSPVIPSSPLTWGKLSMTPYTPYKVWVKEREFAPDRSRSSSISDVDTMSLSRRSSLTSSQEEPVSDDEQGTERNNFSFADIFMADMELLGASDTSRKLIEK